LFTNSGHFKGFAYVQFEKAEDAEKAVARATGTFSINLNSFLAAESNPSEAIKLGESVLKIQHALALRGGKKPTKLYVISSSTKIIPVK
jgi:hypothetical protein